MTAFSDHIVFVDESGDHGLTGIDPQFPVFALAFCVLRKEDYITRVTPAFQRFKFEFFGHDEVVLHEHEIRKQQQPFTFLRADPDLHRAVVFLLTSSDTVEDREAAYDEHVAGYVLKQDHARFIELLNHYWTTVVLPEIRPGGDAHARPDHLDRR